MSATESIRNKPFLPPLTRWAGLVLILLTIVALAALPMSWQQQAVFGGVVVLCAVIVSRLFRADTAVYVLILLSASATARYAWWRVDSLHHYLFSPWTHPDLWNSAAMLLLLSADDVIE